MSSEVRLRAAGKVLEMGEHDFGSAGWGVKLGLFLALGGGCVSPCDKTRYGGFGVRGEGQMGENWLCLALLCPARPGVQLGVSCYFIDSYAHLTFLKIGFVFSNKLFGFGSAGPFLFL